MERKIEELKVTANLMEGDKIIDFVERKFAFIELEEGEEGEVKPLDETISEFIQAIEEKVKEKEMEIEDRDKFYTNSVMSLILFFVKPSSNSAILKVPVKLKEEKPEEEKVGKPPDSG